MSYDNKTGYPSVTEVIRPYVNAEFFTEESRERGTAVHAACAAHLHGKYVVPLKNDWRGYFDSFKTWCDMAEPTPIYTEERLIDTQYGFCGKPDFCGKIKGIDGVGIADWKTSITIGKSWPIQIAAYRSLSPVITSWGLSLRLKSDGGMPLANIYKDQTLDLNLFMSALNIHKYFKE